ncbi:MAG TPA: hypothetical protein VG714_07915 [Acidobacteriaceae bacterium]|nr:hypothetical protein [Acidobacteriaceae bacterium]
MKPLAFLLLLTATFVPAQRTAPDSLGRYQMTTVTLEGNERTALLLDTATGKVWKYQGGFESKGKDGQDHFNPPRFIVIPVDGLTH